MDYSLYEKQKNTNTKINEKLLGGFKYWLLETGLTSKTVQNHIGNVEFYINEFLTYYEVITADAGWSEMDDYFSDWLIRKTFATEYTIKKNITSLKKFYKFLYEENIIEKKDYDLFLETIKENKEGWIKAANQYNDNAEYIAYEDDYNNNNIEKEHNIVKVKSLFEAVKKFSQLKPWKEFGNTDVFGIKFHDEEDIFFCSILGYAGEAFGLSIYKGLEGIESYFKLLDSKYDLEEEMIHVMDTCTVYFDDRKDIEKEDYELIQMSGITFKGKKQWPSFRVFEPGFTPRLINPKELNLLERIFSVINDYIIDLKENYDKASLLQYGKCNVREYSLDNTYTDVIYSYSELHEKNERVIEIPVIYNELQVRRIKKTCKIIDDIWEIDSFYHIIPVEENEEIYFPSIFLTASVNMEIIVGYSLTHPYNIAENAQDYLLSLFSDNKIIPKRIILSDEKIYMYLNDIFEKLDIPVDVVDKLNVIPNIKKELFNDILNDERI